MQLLVTPFFDAATHSFTFVLIEPDTRCCAIVDPVLDYDPESGSICTRSADGLVEFVQANGLIVEWLLETHIHADHLSASRYLKSRFVCAQMGIGAGVRSVRELIDAAAPDPEATFDRLFERNDRISLGRASGRVLCTPGHTPSCVSYQFEDLVLVGDALFMPDFGTPRCDFPGGNARRLYRSIRKLLALPGSTRLLTGHDYGPGGRPVRFLSTVDEQRRTNVHVNCGIAENEFVRRRTDRDATLEPPCLMAAAVPFNLAGGSKPVTAGSAPGLAAA